MISGYLVDGTNNLSASTNKVTVAEIKAGLVPTVGTSDKNKYLHANETTGALEWADASDVEANVQIPAGATVQEIWNLKIGNNYYILPGLASNYIVGNTLVADDPNASISGNGLDVGTSGTIDNNTLEI